MASLQEQEQEQEQKTAACAIFFKKVLKGIIQGHESGLYKSKDQVPPMTIPYILPNITLNYFNAFYKGLADKSDEYVVGVMEHFKTLTNHSPVCLINLLCQVCLKVHLSFDRSKLTPFTVEYKPFMDLVNQEFKSKVPSMDELMKLFDHPCDGPRIVEPLKKGEQMFTLNNVQFFTEKKK